MPGLESECEFHLHSVMWLHPATRDAGKCSPAVCLRGKENWGAIHNSFLAQWMCIFRSDMAGGVGGKDLVLGGGGIWVSCFLDF